MALLEGGAGDVGARLLAAEPHQEGLARLHAIQHQPGPHEGHGTSLRRDIEKIISNKPMRHRSNRLHSNQSSRNALRNGGT